MRACFENCAKVEGWKRSEGEKEEAKRGVEKKEKIRVVGALSLCLSPRKGSGSREGEERVSIFVGHGPLH